MLDIDRAAYEAEAQQLRLALKTWETAWARDHGGAKPGRDDIKANDIAKQYTAYNRVRGILAGKIAPADAKDARDRTERPKRKPDVDAAHAHATPSKRRAVSHETPSRRTATSAAATTKAAAETPSISRRLFSPVVPTSIGPTPQRDGRVLGLFDVLAEEEDMQKRRQSIEATPSRRDSTLLGSTPRKQTIDINYAPDSSDDDNSDNDENTVNVRRLGRTPMSSGRRNLLNHFTAPPRPPAFEAARDARAARAARGALGSTPLKSRDANAQKTAHAALLVTPSKGRAAAGEPVEPVEFATPAFLRRQTFSLAAPAAAAIVDENAAAADNTYFCSPPNKLRLPRKPLVRGLSSVLASLRKAEDERLDEELEIMREVEGEAGAATSTGAEDKDGDNLEMQQLEEMEALLEEPEGTEEPGGKRLLGGFDDEGLYDSAPEDAHDRGHPLRVYKKKGQKRTTRLVNMRPTRTKRAAAAIDAAGGSGDDEDDDVVPETQAKTGVAEGGGETGKKTKTTTTTKEGTVKKAVRKVNELAHANFKRLKIKNTGTKGGQRFNSRFRRRR